MRSTLAATAALIMTAVPAFADDFFASDAAGVTQALAQAGPGDTIVLTNGTWTDQVIRFRGNGAAGQPLTLRAQTPGAVLLNGSSRLEIGGAHLVVEGLLFQGGALGGDGNIVRFESGGVRASDSVLRDSAFISYNPPDRETRYQWISLRGVRNIVERCRFEDHDHSGVTIAVEGDWPNDHIIRDNYFVDRPDGDANGWETIRIGTSTVNQAVSRTIVESNLFERTDGEIEIISDKTAENVHRYNTFLECSATLTLRHAKDATVNGNFFLGGNVSGSGGIRVVGSGHRIFNNYFEDIRGRTSGIIALTAANPDPEPSGYQPVRDVVIAHNTFVGGNDYAFNLFQGATPDRTDRPRDVLIYGNLISIPGERVANESNPFLTWENNAVFSNGLGTAPGSGFSQLGSSPVSQSADGIFRPVANGPADNAATTSPVFVIDDLDGDPRGSPADLGADEITLTQPLRTALAATEVGPLWLRPPDPDLTPDGTRGVFIEAETPDEIADPDNDGVSFAALAEVSASGGMVLKSSDGARSDDPATGGVARYSILFPAAGTYRAYYKARGSSTSRDSFFRPTALDADPSALETTSSDNVFRWETDPTAYTVDMPFRVFDFAIGRRERDTEIDAIVFYPGDELTDGELDALLATGPTDCARDVNRDGLTDFRDVLGLLSLVDAGSLRGDFTGDGALNVNDPRILILTLEAGCG